MESRRSRVDAGTMLGIGRTMLVAALLRSVALASSPAETVPLATWALQNNLTTLNERLHHLYTSGRYSDLTIRFSNNNKTVSVHRLMLAVSSSVFEPMLMGPSPVGEELVLQDPPNAFTKLLDHMYHEEMDLRSVDEALSVYATALKYQVHSASKMCSQYIRDHLTEETTLAALEAAVDFGDDALREMCVKMLNKNPDAAIAPASVLRLKKETLKGLLQGELRVTSETRIFDAVLAWGRAQLSQRAEEPSSSALRREVDDLLGVVRFKTMTCEEFIDKVVPTSVLSPVEALHLLRAIRGDDLPLFPGELPSSNSTKNRIQIKSELSCVGSQYHSYIDADSWTPFLQNFRSTKHILLESLQLYYDGRIRINKDGAVVASASSENSKFVFQNPVRLQAYDTYEFSFNPYKRLPAVTPIGQEEIASSTITTFLYIYYYCLDISFFFRPVEELT